MEITLLIMENHGIVIMNFCGNPDLTHIIKRDNRDDLWELYCKTSVIKKIDMHSLNITQI